MSYYIYKKKQIIFKNYFWPHVLMKVQYMRPSNSLTVGALPHFIICSMPGCQNLQVNSKPCIVLCKLKTCYYSKFTSGAPQCLMLHFRNQFSSFFVQFSSSENGRRCLVQKSDWYPRVSDALNNRMHYITYM